jgi:hypothetical protein
MAAEKENVNGQLDNHFDDQSERRSRENYNDSGGGRDSGG